MIGKPMMAAGVRAESVAEGMQNMAVPAGDLDGWPGALAAQSTETSLRGDGPGKPAQTRTGETITDSALDYAPFVPADKARTEDAREDFAAFNERRSPNWSGA